MSFSQLFRSDPAEAPTTDNSPAPAIVYDPIERLPPAAADKLRAIRRAASDSHSILQPIWEELRELHETRWRSVTFVAELTSGRHDGRRYSEDNPAVAREREKIARISAEIERLQAAHDDRADKWRAFASVRDQLEGYLKIVANHRAGIELAPPVAATLQKGETPASAVARVRKQIEKLREDLHSIEDAPHHSTFAKKLAREKIEALASRGRPNTLISIEAGKPFEFPTIASGGGAVAISGSMQSLPFHRVIDGEALIAWLFRDQLLARVEREIDENSDDASALTDEQRAKKTLQTRAAILAAERDEEALIVAAQEANVTIHRRPDADPRAVLGLADNAPEPRNDLA